MTIAGLIAGAVAARRCGLRTGAAVCFYVAFVFGLEDPAQWWCWLFAAITGNSVGRRACKP